MRSKGFESGKPRRCKNIEATRGAAAHSGLHTQLLQRTIYVNAVRVCYENNTFHTGHHHLRIGPYKGSVNSVQNQMPFRYSAVLDAPSALRAAHKLLVFLPVLIFARSIRGRGLIQPQRCSSAQVGHDTITRVIYYGPRFSGYAMAVKLAFGSPRDEEMLDGYLMCDLLLKQHFAWSCSDCVLSFNNTAHSIRGRDVFRSLCLWCVGDIALHIHTYQHSWPLLLTILHLLLLLLL